MASPQNSYQQTHPPIPQKLQSFDDNPPNHKSAFKAQESIFPRKQKKEILVSEKKWKNKCGMLTSYKGVSKFNVMCCSVRDRVAANASV